jgi:hypothetical protein
MPRLVLWFVLAFAGVAVPAFAQQAPATENPDAKYEWKGPSGFWTNPRPAKGGAYRWRMMAVGGGLLLITGYVMLRLVKKASTERARR